MDMQPVSSSLISAIGYDAEEKKLGVEFARGGTYEYDDVPPEAYEEFIGADSIGKYFLANIKNNYSYTKV